MPADFKLDEHNLRRLNVACATVSSLRRSRTTWSRSRTISAQTSSNSSIPIFDGRPLKLLGVHRNTLPGNWKLYQENLKDPYHATLLHTYLTTFGLFVAGNKTMILTDPKGRHSTLCNARPMAVRSNDESKSDIRSFHAAMQLADPRVIELIPEKDSSGRAMQSRSGRI